MWRSLTSLVGPSMPKTATGPGMSTPIGRSTVPETACIFAAFFGCRRPSDMKFQPDRQFRYEISDPDGKPVYQKSLTTNSNGTIHDEFAVDSACCARELFHPRASRSKAR